ncbi:YaiI/YqxD family protein [Marinicrinis lubricantis]|uniref:UPF0178 protein ACFPXP_20750 n=1 Tax=Marinicrinis lubricantis TaxID=2086470 RepID=A0ABW1IV54_9BACL
MSEEIVIYVDADACPVKQQIISAARDMGVKAVFVSTIDHHLDHGGGSETIHYVQLDRAFQSVDMYIANQIRPGQLLVTQDFGLAAIALGKRAVVVSNRGEQYTSENIDYLLAVRHLNAKKRRGGGKTKGPKAMTDADRKIFLQALTNILRILQEK